MAIDRNRSDDTGYALTTLPLVVVLSMGDFAHTSFCVQQADGSIANYLPRSIHSSDLPLLI